MIELQKWKPDPNDPRYVVEDGQPTVNEVFYDLKEHLEAIGYLPDEYFLQNSDWEEYAEVPPGAWIDSVVDYGGSEGIYIDTYLHWRDAEQNLQHKSLATGKTLGETYEDLKRMNLIAAAVTEAFHGGHSRYIKLGPPDRDNGLTIQVNRDERNALVESLLETRAMQKAAGDSCAMVDQLLRRLLGSVTEFIQTVGDRNYLTNEDLLELSIHDSNLEKFDTLLHKVELAPELLLVAAGHPGRVGAQMTYRLLECAGPFPPELYEKACENAVDIGDTNRVAELLRQAVDAIQTDCLTLPGRVLTYSMRYRREHSPGTKMAEELLKSLTPEQAKAIEPQAFLLAWEKHNYSLARALVESGIDLSGEAAKLYWKAAKENDSYLLWQVQQSGADINASNGWALRFAMENNNQDAAKLLVENGADAALLMDVENGAEFMINLYKKFPELVPSEDVAQSETQQME